MNIEIRKASESKLKPNTLENLGFGEIFSDHMLYMDYADGKWQTPQIVPFGDLGMSPALCSLHYGQAIFEGLKGFYTQKGEIYVYRPQKYHERMNRSCQRLCIPEMEYEVFIHSLLELLKIDKAWIPRKRGYSVYIRPLFLLLTAF